MTKSNKLTNTIMKAFNNPLNIDTSLTADVGSFGVYMLLYGECYIGTEIWIKNGLTLQDKLNYEAYIELCDSFEPDLLEIEKYELGCSTEHKDIIITTIVEINKLYEIGNGEDKRDDDDDGDEYK